jgi:serine/threonine protein kinase
MNDTTNELPDGGNDPTRVTGAPSGNGAAATTSWPHDDAHTGGEAAALPAGSRLAEFEITALVGQGGFGTVYEARDHALERIVAIKEYLPVSLSLRRSDGTVQPVSPHQSETFELGMRSFINEARLLAQFDHPSLLKVYRFWQERGTAYMAMPFYRGPTLRQALAKIPGGADESFLLHIVDDLTQALMVMHRANCYHRDIAPDNILLLEYSNRPVLLDFGAARRVITNKTQTITTILKPGYAPIEQYAEMPNTPQGAWTDVYALAAVLHVAITGQTPPPSVARLLADGYAPLAANPQLRKRFGARLLAGIDAGLAVRPEARPQSVAAFRQLLGLGEDAAKAALPTPPSTRIQRAEPTIAQKVRKSALRGKDLHRAKTAAAAVALLLAVGLGWWLLRGGETSSNAAPPPAVPTDPSPAAKEKAPENPPNRTAKRPILVLAAKEQAPQNPGYQTAQGQPSPPTTQEQTPPNPVDQAAQEQPSPPVSQEQAPENPADQAAPALPSPPAQPRTPADFLAALAAGADSDFHVSATPRQQTMRVGKDKLGFEIRSSRPGYVYVYLLSTNGQLSLLFPNLLDKNNRIQANRALVLPRTSWPMIAGGPPGTSRFAVLVSKHARSFIGSGLRSNAIFPKFSLPNLAALDAARGDKPSPLLGRPACGSRAGCRDIYGVGMFEITEQ